LSAAVALPSQLGVELVLAPPVVADSRETPVTEVKAVATPVYLKLPQRKPMLF